VPGWFVWNRSHVAYIIETMCVIATYELPNVLPSPFDQTVVLANTATRLKKFEAALQERIINWGYAVCDAAVRKHVESSVPAPSAFPYAKAGVG
jgi:NTE family protein